MKGITFCVLLCSVSLNAMPSELDNQLRIIEGLRRRGGAAKLGEEISGGIAGSISTSIAALAGLGLSVLEAIGGGIVGIGDKTSLGLINGLTAVHNLRRSERRLEANENVLNSPQELDMLRRREIADPLRRHMDDGVPTLGLPDGLRRKGGAATLGEEIAGGIAGSISTSIAALAGLGLSVLEAIGGGIVGIGDKTSLGLINGLTGVHNLRRSLRSEFDGIGNEGVDEHFHIPVNWLDDPYDSELIDSGIGILGVGDIHARDVGIAGIGKIFCTVLCSVSLNALPSGLDDRLPIIEGFRRQGGAANLGEEIAGGIAGSHSTSTGLLTGLGLKVLEAIGGGILGVGDKTSGLTTVGDLERKQPPLLIKENVHNSLQKSNESKRGEMSDSLSPHMDGGVSRLDPEPDHSVIHGNEGVVQIIHSGVPSGLQILDGSRRKGEVDEIGKEIGVGVPKNSGIPHDLNAVLDRKLNNLWVDKPLKVDRDLANLVLGNEK
ncbi:unnamed protein product, partial [Brenthis ino]